MESVSKLKPAFVKPNGTHTVLNNNTSHHHSKDRIPKVCFTSALPSKRPQRSCLRSRSNSISEGGTVTFSTVCRWSDGALFCVQELQQLFRQRKQEAKSDTNRIQSLGAQKRTVRKPFVF